MARRGRRMLRRAMTDAVQGARGCAARWRMVCGEMADVVQGGRRMVVHVALADGLQGATRCCAVCCRETADAAPCVGRWFVESRRALRGELAGRWLAGSRRMLRGKQADGEQRVRSADTSKPPPVMPTACAHKGMRASVCVSGCCAGSERMVRGGAASGAQGTGRRGTRRGGEWCAYSQQKVRRDYIWLARAIAHFGKRAIHQVKRVCSP